MKANSEYGLVIRRQAALTLRHFMDWLAAQETAYVIKDMAGWEREKLLQQFGHALAQMLEEKP